jgi:hypothetical protein
MPLVETKTSTPNLTWIDGDIVVLQPLNCLSPMEDTQFMARAEEGYLGSNGSNERHLLTESLRTLGSRFQTISRNHIIL